MAESMKLIQGPSPVETTTLHFKLQCKIKIFDSKIKYASGNCCVVAASQHYGLIFVGTTTGFLIIRSQSLNNSNTPDKCLYKNVHLNLRPAFISVDNSQKILAVICNSKAGAIMFLFQIAVLFSKKVAALKFHAVSHLAKSPTAEVVDVVWQPNTDGGIAICMTDGSVLSFRQPATNELPFTLPSTTEATCLCWSPKGKQIVIGSAEGTLSQYKPDLKIVKTLPRPPLYFENTTVLSVLWISNYQFLAAYTSRDDPNFFPVFTIYNAPKNEPINIVNFEDVTYTTNLFRIHQPYMIHQVSWNMIFVTSSNSVEVAVLHSNDGTTWEQWLMGDASRAELPLNANREETFPLGWTFDYTNMQSDPWVEGSEPLPPRLLILTDEGLLCVFNVVNTAPNLPQLCSHPKEPIDVSLFSDNLSSPESQPVSFEIQKSGNSKPSFGSAATFESLSAQPQIPTSVTQVALLTQSSPDPENKDAPLIPQQQQQQPVSPLQPSQFQVHQPPVSTPHFGAPPTVSSSNSSLLPAKPESPVETPTVAKPQNVYFGVKPPTSQSRSFATPSKLLFFSKSVVQSTSKIQPEPTPNETPKASVTKTTEEPVSEAGSLRSDTPELAEVDNNVYLKALQEEIDHFDSELRELKVKVGSMDIQLGTEEEKLKMKNSIEEFSEFWKELKETTEGQSSEIHAVVMDLMEAFAWLENAKSRNLQRKNPSYIELKKSEELDPISTRYMNEISDLKYYIENQLKQLCNYLDKEWMDHQENCRNQIKREMAVPSLEEVYRTMHLQLKILHKQQLLVEELKEKVSTKKRKNKSPMSITNDSLICTSTPNRYSELSKLAQNLLQLEIDKVEHPTQEKFEILKSHLRSIAERSKKLTSDKQAALRDALSERDTVKIRPVKTTFETSSFLRFLSSPKTVQPKPKTKVKPPATKPAFLPPVTVEEPKPQPQPPTERPEEKSTPPKETTKGIFVFGSAKPADKPVIPLTVQALPKAEETSPLASLSGIVSNIGKKTEPAFVFGSQKPEQKPEEVKTFTFAAIKSADATPFTKKDPPIFGAKPSFSFGNLTTATTKPEVTITPIPITTSAAATTTPTLTFNFGTATTTATTLPKMNLIFGKEQTTIITTAAIFGGTKTTNLFETPKTTEAPAQVAFSVVKTSNNKVGQEKDVLVASVVKHTEEVDVVNVEDVEETKKPETPTDVAEDAPVAVTSESPKPSVASPAPPDVTAATATPTTSPETPSLDVKATVTATATSGASPTTSALIFGQAASTTNIFGQPATTTTTAVFGQVSSTMPTPSVFGLGFAKPVFDQASTFGASAPNTTATALVAMTPPATTSFESTPTSNIFEISTSTPTFGQKPDTVSQTTNIFNQLLLDNRSVFGSNTTASTTTTNIFTTPENIFNEASTTTAPLFGTPATSIFQQTTSVFGQMITSTNVFGQSQTPTSSSFFNQNICSPFRGNLQSTTPTSNQTFESGGFSKPIFGGAPTFRQATGNTSIFGGSPSSSIFGVGSSTTSGNVFNTPTTSSTFGSTSPGPFSSGGGSVAQTGFAPATSTFQSSVGGFGSPPVFGSGPPAPAFGGSPTFGGSASFGSLPSFGSFSQGAFSQSSGSATFAIKANQNTVGFANLAQQSQNQGFASGGGFRSSGFENKPAFGGNSFSSWRSK